MQYFHISDKELEKVAEFRRFISDNGYCLNLPDEMLYRYLVTSDGRMAPALSKLIKMIEWRNENHIDTLLQDVYSRQLTTILQRKLRFCEHGHDKLQRPVTIIRIGAFELCDILKEYGADDILRVFHYYTEYIEQKCAAISQQLGRQYTGNVTLMDMEGLSLRKHLHPKAILLFKQLVLINTYYYPESCQQVLVMNDPPIFAFFWRIIKPLMNELQFTKLTKIQSKEELFSIIDKDQLPCQYGGSCRCKMDSILFDEQGSIDHEKDGVLLIPQGESAELKIPVEEGDHIVITFSILGGDIIYSAFSIIDNIQHDYCNKRIAESKQGLINVSFVIVTSGEFVMQFSSLDPQNNSCVIGYEVSID